MAGRGRGCSGGNGYESYDYTYDYGHESAGSYSFESWMTSCPMPSNDGTKHLGPGRDSYGAYNRLDRSRYEFSEPQGGYGNRRAQLAPYPSQVGWGGGGDARGGFGGNQRPQPVRGPNRPMPLLNQRAFQEVPAFQGMRAFTGNSYFGGGFKQKSRKLWKDKKKVGTEGGPAEKKMTSTEDNGAKSEELESEGDGDNEETGPSTKTACTTETEQKTEALEGKDKERKQAANRKPQENPSRRLRDRMVERIQFVCSLCKFRTFYDEEMTSHLQSEFHKEHFRYVGGKLPKQSADFLQEYVLHKTKKTEERRNVVEDLSTTIQQIYRDQDVTQDLGMEHFVKKVEAAHCAACDVFIPMNPSALQRHVRAPMHNLNRRNMMENSKKTALAVARSILNNKLISQKLERYIKGQNPFTEESDEATNTSSAALEASEDQEMAATSTDFCENEDLPEHSASIMNSEEGGEEEMTEDTVELCPAGDQEEFTDAGVIRDPLRSEDE